MQIRMRKLVPATHLHWPKMTVSPSATLKQGDTWTGTFVCLFSYLHLHVIFRLNPFSGHKAFLHGI